jgi:hypothetical protein
MEYVILAFSFITLAAVAYLLFQKGNSDLSSLENIFNNRIQAEFQLNREELSKNLKKTETN